MLVPAFNILMEAIIVIIFAIVCYQIFLSDIVNSNVQARKERAIKIACAEKIFHLKIISNNTKDIEAFITSSATDLSEDKVKQLVRRVEYLNADKALIESFKEYEKAEARDIANAPVNIKVKR